MLLRVSLRNYRSIESAEVELARFSLLVGPNSSGKSNFADALVLASELGFDAASAIQRRGGLQALRRWGIPDEEALQVKVRASASREALDVSYAEQSFSLVPEEGARWKFQDEHFQVLHEHTVMSQYTRAGWQFTEHPATAWQPPALPPTTSIMLTARQWVPWDVLQVRRLCLDVAKMRGPQAPGETETLREDGSNIASVLKRMRGQDERGFAFVLAALRRLVPGLEDILVEELGGFLVLRFSQRQGSRLALLTASNMSEGTLRALGIIVAAQTLALPPSSPQPSPPEMLIVEEPEVAIHPGAAALLFEVLKRASQRGFVLVTTHSPELLDAAQDEEILVCNYREGTTHVGPLSTAQREVVREGLFSLSELARSEPLLIEGEEPPSLDPRDFGA
ncbi:AAA family ATPase [Cystobacter fuscus]|uniref:AAA family ATPase n=1 Tax=Cystobacter fuscus TaxID=43 RepID=UPI002B2BDB8F|nr:AAA family ATPase [Cystobacter fuscus]